MANNLERTHSLVNNTYKKSLIVKRKPKRSATFKHDDIDTLSPNKRIKRNVDDKPESPKQYDDDEQTLSPDVYITPPSPCPYVASPSWIIPDSLEEKINEETLPNDIIKSLINDELEEDNCKLNSQQEAQECKSHGPNFYKDMFCNLFD